MGYPFGRHRYGEKLYSRWPDWWNTRDCGMDVWEAKVCAVSPWSKVPAPLPMAQHRRTIVAVGAPHGRR